MATSHLSRPTSPPIAGQYTRPEEQAFFPSPPQQYGEARPIPLTNVGITAQQVFHKINHALSGGRPLAKIVIGTQQARF